MDSSQSESLGSQFSELTLDERYLTSDVVDCLSREDQKKLKKCRIGKSKNKCTVCLEQYQKNEIIQILPCHHKFHYKCLKPWFNKSSCCPNCRFDLKKHFHPKKEEALSEFSTSSEQRNPLLDASFIQPRNYTPLRSHQRSHQNSRRR
jgi:hypothetical protein